MKIKSDSSDKKLKNKHKMANNSVINKNKMLIATITTAAVIALCAGSAIPMWEYLSRGEKMSHLYSTFAKQVSAYCKSSSDNPAQCKRELLMYGLGKLHDMNEAHLDSMDPYQRGASDIIWDSMMDGHPSNTKKEITTPAMIQYPTGQFQKNPLFDEKPQSTATKKSGSASYASDMDFGLYASGPDAVYAEPHNSIVQAPTNVNYQYAPRPSPNSLYNNYLSGPMVIRVRPDGTPVEEDKQAPLPRDDDRDAMQLGREQLPTLDQIAGTFRVDSSTGKYLASESAPKYFTFTPTGFRSYRITDRTMKYH